MAFGEVGTSLSKVKASSLNLAGTYGFSGTLSGLADETPLVLISTFTSDGSDDTANFTSNINSTYKEYLFIFNNIHAQTDDVSFLFNFSADSGSNYNVTKTTTFFEASHLENGSDYGFGYAAGRDLAQSTDFQMVMGGGADLGADNDQSVSGILKLYNPSSTTFVKHFMGSSSFSESRDWAWSSHFSGYCNTTSAINAVQFKMSSGQIQGGTIDLFGVV